LTGLGLIQPCEGKGVLIGDNPNELSEVQFELTQSSLDTLRLKRRVAQRIKDSNQLRNGRLNLSHLVLSAPVKKALQMALAQVRHRNVLMEQWGLAEAFPYGREGHDPSIRPAGYRKNGNWRST